MWEIATARKKERYRLVRGKLVAATLDDLSVAVGRSRRTVQDWIKRGCECKVSGGYNVTAAFDWALENVSTAKPKSSPVAAPKPAGTNDPNDPLIGDAEPTEALERLRAAKARLAEMDISERKKTLVPAATLQQILSEAAARIRQANDNLGRRFGPEAQLILNEAIDAAGALIDRIGETTDTD